MKHVVFALFTAFASIAAFAQTKSPFTAAEVQVHQRNIALIVNTASNCLNEIYDDHVSFHRQWRVSKYFGGRRTDYATLDGRIRQLRAYGYTQRQISVIAPQQESISCIGLTMRCLEKGFRAAGTQGTWNKIYNVLKIDAKFDGTDLQILLRQLGWKVLYWNPDPSQNEAWDQDDRELNPLTPGRTWMAVWGGHANNYRSVMKKKIYYRAPVDDASTLVGFKTSVPAAFKNVPFFVGTAHSGYHVFPGLYGKVIEGHSMRAMNALNNLEVANFNPLAPAGAPRWTRSEKYRSGIIAVPPAF